MGCRVRALADGFLPLHYRLVVAGWAFESTKKALGITHPYPPADSRSYCSTAGSMGLRVAPYVEGLPVQLMSFRRGRPQSRAWSHTAAVVPRQRLVGLRCVDRARCPSEGARVCFASFDVF